MKSKDHDTRYFAAMVIGAIASDEALNCLKMSENDPDPEVRNEVKRAIGDITYGKRW